MSGRAGKKKVTIRPTKTQLPKTILIIVSLSLALISVVTLIVAITESYLSIAGVSHQQLYDRYIDNPLMSLSTVCIVICLLVYLVKFRVEANLLFPVRIALVAAGIAVLATGFVMTYNREEPIRNAEKTLTALQTPASFGKVINGSVPPDLWVYWDTKLTSSQACRQLPSIFIERWNGLRYRLNPSNGDQATNNDGCDYSVLVKGLPLDVLVGGNSASVQVTYSYKVPQ